MDARKLKHRRQERRTFRVRSNIKGTAETPRLSVFRSSKHIYAQLIDDLNEVTLAAVSSLSKDLRAAVKYGGNKKAAEEVGKKLAEIAKSKNITKAAFDRGHYRFHGRVEALAVAATKAGLVCCNPENIKKPEPKQAEPAAKPAAKPKGEKKPAKA
jgi:large subunit ribosomal protein L18